MFEINDKIQKFEFNSITIKARIKILKVEYDSKISKIPEIKFDERSI